jgi:alpha,alpha-trehalase
MAEENPKLNLVVKKLSLPLDRAAYRKLSDEPGLLALDMDREVNTTTGDVKLSAVPFVVPGGWFNEFFGWDSYFIGLGLILAGKTDLVKSIVRNWIFEIQHYGLIPNANRSYFILRSQPPFLTDLCLRVYKETSRSDPDAKKNLKRGIEAAIKEYHSVWVNQPYLDEETGLSRYRPKGYGIPPEVDLEFFRPILEPYAEKHKLSVEELAERFTDGDLDDPELEDYFLHDRALRESGHDTQNRLEGRTADLAIIDLNCLLYKFETDIAYAIDGVFEGDFWMTEEFRTVTMAEDDCNAETWRQRAARRKAAMDKYLWNAERGIYVDYNTKSKKQEVADSPTCLWALWCGVASPEQAKSLVANALPLFEYRGGLASSSKETGFMYTRRSYQSQWDYPHGWAPHQMLAWDGLVKYEYKVEAARLAYRWLGTILNVFVHYNGAVVEKYDVTKGREAHQVDTEYPNQGFSYQAYVKEG